MSLRATGRPRLGSTWAQRYCMWKLLLGTWPVAAAVPAEICGCQLLSSLQMFRVVVYHSELTHSPTSSAIFCHYIPQSHWYKWLKLTFYTCLTSSNRYFSGVREIFYNVTLKLITKQQYLMLQRALKKWLLHQSWNSFLFNQSHSHGKPLPPVTHPDTQQQQKELEAVELVVLAD